MSPQHTPSERAGKKFPGNKSSAGKSSFKGRPVKMNISSPPNTFPPPQVSRLVNTFKGSGRRN